MLRYAFLTLAIVLMQSHAHAQDHGASPPPDQSNDSNQLGGPPAQILHRLFDQEYGWESYEFPEEAMSHGNYAGADRITDISLEAANQRTITRKRFLGLLHRIGKEELNLDDQLNYDLFELKLTNEIESEKYGLYLAPIGGMGGPQTSIPQMADRVRFASLEDYENYLTRLALTCDSVDVYLELMNRGLKEGITPPKVTLDGVPAQFDALLNGGLNVLRRPFDHMPDFIPAAKQNELKARFDNETLPALTAAVTKLRDYFINDYLPKCRDTIAATDLPNGKELYSFQLHVMTTTDLTAEQIFAIGQSEVARIHKEMLAVIRKTDFMDKTPSATSMDDEALFKAFLEYLRTDHRFYYDKPEDLLDGYRVICKTVDPWLTRLFGTTPRLTYGVKEIPAFMAPDQTTAYYQPGDARNAEPGWFYANTYALDQRPKYEMIPLALHESVPGHHLQISIAKELEGLPEFRKEEWFTAFGEGWALYSESLGTEMGLYNDPYNDFGRLLYEMWRACRLVVDPGMHAMGWPRAKAIQFMLDNTALSELNITNEVDRYISWPGQACGYKLGEITIQKLRKEAEQKLGAKFDLRTFHDVVLGAGCIPLNILEQRVREWIAGQVEN